MIEPVRATIVSSMAVPAEAGSRRPAGTAIAIAQSVTAGLLLGLGAIAVVYVVGIRSRNSTVRQAARRFHLAIGNRLQMRSAGRAGTYASVIRHRGRRTGKAYATPVWAEPTEDGFVIRIVYGSRTDWLRNVLASGRATIVYQGQAYAIDRAEVVPMAVARRYFPISIRWIDRLMGIDRCLRVRRVPSQGRKITMRPRNEYQVIPLPKARRFMEEAIRSTHNKPMMHGLVEVDVTKARTCLREVSARTGTSPSFTGFVISCLGQAVHENKYVHALRKGRRHLVLFNDVDVLTWIERELGGEPQVLPCIVRSANRKTFDEISDEIRAAQVQDVRTIDVAGAKESQALPTWLYRPYFELATRIGTWFPREWKKRWGTVTVTAVGMVDPGVAFWGIPPSSPSVCWITIGGISQKRQDLDGEVIVREYLNLTVSFDHRMIDAAPAGRFVKRFKELMESAYGLTLLEDPIAKSVARQRVPAPVAVAQ